MKKPVVELASFKISFMGRNAPGAAVVVAAAAGGVAMAGADAGAAGVGGAVCA